MEITFDDRMRRSNLVKHGYDFAELDAAFFARSRVIEARSGRLMAIGRFDDAVISVIFRPLGTEGLAIVSMRDASTKERRLLWQN
jgi:uncharacterized DUF497 family protein